MPFDKEKSCCCMVSAESSLPSPSQVSTPINKKQSLVAAIYDRYSELSSENLSDWSFNSCSSTSSSQSSSIDSSPVLSPSLATSKNMSTNPTTSLSPSSSSNVVSFYIPTSFSPRKTRKSLLFSVLTEIVLINSF